MADAYEDCEDVIQRFLAKQDHRSMTVYDAACLMIEEIRARAALASSPASPLDARREALEEAARALESLAVTPTYNAAAAPYYAKAAATVRALASPPQKALDPEARLRAFAERYGASMAIWWGQGIASPWLLRWTRLYGERLSDARTVQAPTLAELVTEAEQWEAENDRREPEHALASPPQKDTRSNEETDR